MDSKQNLQWAATSETPDQEDLCDNELNEGPRYDEDGTELDEEEYLLVRKLLSGTAVQKETPADSADLPTIMEDGKKQDGEKHVKAIFKLAITLIPLVVFVEDGDHMLMLGRLVHPIEEEMGKFRNSSLVTLDGEYSRVFPNFISKSPFEDYLLDYSKEIPPEPPPNDNFQSLRTNFVKEGEDDIHQAQFLKWINWVIFLPAPEPEDPP
ncbi:hypothetical protein HanIR_Chr05g0224191 [Helianthus annuus]|nr:hypothetical protein HanIR_Chr05g0224191 [Helianthus annuus]